MHSTGLHAIPPAIRPDASATLADETERIVAAVWSEVLGHTEFRREDEFYAVGGDSLKAVQVIAQLETTCRVSVPPSRFAEASTIEKQAQLILESRNALPAEPGKDRLLVIRNSTDRMPLYCFPGDCGRASVFHPLAEAIGPHKGVTVIGYESLIGRRPPPAIEAFAEEIIQTLREAQPAGPFFLGGYCFGASVAFEVARQLRAGGSQVALLSLWDPEPGLASWPLRRRWKRRYLEFASRFHSTFIRRKSPPQSPGFKPPAPVDRSTELRMVARKLLRDYRHRPYPGEVSLVYSADGRHPTDADYWRRLIKGKVQFFANEGTHFTMLHPPHVDQLGAMLLAQLHGGRAAEMQPRTD